VCQVCVCVNKELDGVRAVPPPSDFVTNSYGESWHSSSKKNHESLSRTNEAQLKNHVSQSRTNEAQIKNYESEIENAWAFM